MPFTVELVDRSVAPEERSDTHFETIKVWVGVLAPWAEESVYYEPEGSEAEVHDYSFSSGEPNLLPSAAGLEKIFSQQYQFASATSGGGGRPPAASGVEQLLTSLEQSLQSVVQSLQRLSGENPRTVTNAKAAPAPCAPPPGLPRRPAGAVDLSVVQAARDAGVPEAQIQEMAALAMQGRSTMADVPKPPPRERRGKKNILSESEEDEVPAVEEVAEVVSGGEVLTTAVQKLTEIAAHLTVEKKKGRAHLRCSVRRCWISRWFRCSQLYQQPEIFSGFEGIEACRGETAGGVVQGVGKEHGHRFPQGLSDARKQSSPSQCSCLVGDALKGARVPNTRETPLGNSGYFGCIEGRTVCRSTLPCRSAVSSRRPDEHRQRQLVGGLGAAAGGSTSDESFQCTRPPYRIRASVHPLDRFPMVGIGAGKVERHRQLEREKEEAQLPQGPQQCRECRDPKSPPQKGRQRRRKRREGRQWEGHCPRKQLTAAGQCLGDTSVRGGNAYDGRGSRAFDPHRRRAFGTPSQRPNAHSGSPLKNRTSSAPGIRKAPGAEATTVSACQLWESQIRWLMSSRGGRLRRFFHSSFSKQVDEAKLTSSPRPVWPIPLPFWGKQSNLKKEERAFQAAINAVVVTLNWLHLDQPSRVPTGFKPRHPLSPSVLSSEE